MRSAAETFRANPGVDVATAITELKVGEALVSLLQPDGSPTPVERTLIRPPASRVGPITPVERKVMIETDAIGAKYDTVVDRESAEELLAAKTAEATMTAKPMAPTHIVVLTPTSTRPRPASTPKPPTSHRRRWSDAKELPCICDANFGSSAASACSICSSIFCSWSERGTDPPVGRPRRPVGAP